MRNILITGCSTGIGEACARDLARRSIRVFAGVRKEEDGRRLQEIAKDQIEPIILDVTDEAGVRAAAAAVRQ